MDIYLMSTSCGTDLQISLVWMQVQSCSNVVVAHHDFPIDDGRSLPDRMLSAAERERPVLG